MRSLLIACALSSIVILTTGCAQTSGPGTPSLSPSERPTSRLPSPSNTQRNFMMDSSNMTAPARP